jgi:hypothetical protein
LEGFDAAFDPELNDDWASPVSGNKVESELAQTKGGDAVEASANDDKAEA